MVPANRDMNIIDMPRPEISAIWVAENTRRTSHENISEQENFQENLALQKIKSKPLHKN